MNGEIFSHAAMSLLSAKRLHSQRKPHLKIRRGKCVDSSGGSLVVIAWFTVTIMCFMLHREWYLYLSSVKKPWQDENFINLPVFSRAYNGAYKWGHGIRFQFSTLDHWKSLVKLFFNWWGMFRPGTLASIFLRDTTVSLFCLYAT
jgi:hypothetical protein